MSAFRPGMANSKVALYEDNTPITTGTTLTGLSADPLPVDGALEYQLLAPQNIVNPKPIIDYLVETTIEFSTAVPVGEFDTSNIRVTIAGNLDRPINFSRDVTNDYYTGTASGQNVGYVTTLGLVKIQYNEPILIKIKRIGGNPDVDIEVVQVYKKFKRLD